ncbi:MAG: hypothetical protein MMC33_008268 [Icmadophila ericetorum]|nr:hypothetical protein [Icmadophila ericetorum]
MRRIFGLGKNKDANQPSEIEATYGYWENFLTETERGIITDYLRDPRDSKEALKLLKNENEMHRALSARQNAVIKKFRSDSFAKDAYIRILEEEYVESAKRREMEEVARHLMLHPEDRPKFTGTFPIPTERGNYQMGHARQRIWSGWLEERPILHPSSQDDLYSASSRLSPPSPQTPQLVCSGAQRRPRAQSKPISPEPSNSRFEDRPEQVGRESLRRRTSRDEPILVDVKSHQRSTERLGHYVVPLLTTSPTAPPRKASVHDNRRWGNNFAQREEEYQNLAQDASYHRPRPCQYGDGDLASNPDYGTPVLSAGHGSTASSYSLPQDSPPQSLLVEKTPYS